MFQQHSQRRYAPFTWTEFAAVQGLEAHHETVPSASSIREPLHVRFLRRLYQQRLWRRVVNHGRPVRLAQTRPASDPAGDGWIDRLKVAYDAGYYRTEAAEGAQASFPWQNKTCRHCPFWSNGICDVRAEYRWSSMHTCRFFDPSNHPEARSLIEERRRQGYRRWWKWFDDLGPAG